MYKNDKLGAPLDSEKRSIIYWLLISVVTLFLFWSPFQKALFNGLSIDFERPIFASVVWSSILLLVIAIWFFLKWKLKTITDAITIASLAIPLTYLISMIPAASHYNAITMLYAQFIFIAFFLVGGYITKNKLGHTIVTSILMVSAYVIVWFGFLNWLGNGIQAGNLVGWFSDTVNTTTRIYKDAVMRDANGLRLTSVFEYANSYAAYLIAFLFAGIYLIARSKRWLTAAVNAFMLVPIVVSFFLTLSRGAIVVIPFILLIILFMQKLHRQILIIIYTLIAFAASLPILQKITDAGTQLQKEYNASLSGNSWLLLLGVSLVVAVVASLIQKFGAPWLEAKLEHFNTKKTAQLFVPVAAIVLGVIGAVLLFADTGFSKVLPENVRTRIENINFAQHSVLERGTFYKDAIKVFKDYPIFGAGGGAWSALYEQYQNNPYVSRQAHNFFLQYLVEVGLFGLLIFLIFLGVILFFFIRRYLRDTSESKESHFVYFIIAISLLIHSIIDFDLSYLYLELLVFLCLGAMIAKGGDAPLKWSTERSLINKGFPALLTVFSLIVLFLSLRLLSANSSYNTFVQVSQTSKDFNQIIKPINSALELHPNHPTYAMQKAGILLSVYNQSKKEEFYTQATDLLNETFKKEPHNRQIIAQKLQAFKLKNQLAEANEFVDAQIPNFTWDITMYEDSIAIKTQLGDQARQAKDTQAMEKNWNAAFDVYNAVLAKMEFLKTLPKEQMQGREFDVTNKIALSLSQIDYLRGDYAAASNMLKGHINDQFDDSINLLAVRWYLAALQKQNKNDKALYDKLIAKDPKEKDQIQSIVNISSP